MSISRIAPVAWPRLTWLASAVDESNITPDDSHISVSWLSEKERAMDIMYGFDTPRAK